MMALIVVLFSQCKKNEEDYGNEDKTVKVSCVVPMNNNGKSDFTNVMTDGSIQWSTGTERIYLALPETQKIIELLSEGNANKENRLTFQGTVEQSDLSNGSVYEIWYFGHSMQKQDGAYYEFDGSSVTGSIATQSGNLSDLGYCHIASGTVEANVGDDGIVLSLNGNLTTQIAIAELDLQGIQTLRGNAIIGTEYALQYNDKDGRFEFSVTEETSTIQITNGGKKSYVVLFPNATDNVALKSNKGKVNFVGGINNNNTYAATWKEYVTNGKGYVDLGLPSGLLWATCNVGAETPEAYGNYYAWGEITTKSNEYSASTSATYGLSISQLQSQGYIDGEGNLNPQYDAATANWGGDWRMPTKAEQEELFENCTWTRTTQNGVNGYVVFTSKKNGNSILLPAAGLRTRHELINPGSFGYYWSSTPYESDNKYNTSAYDFYFGSGSRNLSDNYRYAGQSVRPVIE